MNTSSHILYTVDATQTASPLYDLGLDKACRYVRNGSIIVFHDSLKAEKNLRYALPPFIEYCLGQGWQFELLY